MVLRQRTVSGGYALLRLLKYCCRTKRIFQMFAAKERPPVGKCCPLTSIVKPIPYSLKIRYRKSILLGKNYGLQDAF